MPSIGERLTGARNRAGRSQEDVAAEAGVSRSRLRAYERIDTEAVPEGYAKLHAVARVLHLDLRDTNGAPANADDPPISMATAQHLPQLVRALSRIVERGDLELAEPVRPSEPHADVQPDTRSETTDETLSHDEASGGQA